ncbi:uncharacterized protein LOC116603707 isoform X2 [Nematostella vectensis]|nr:uncharacterized protein LOC116603707 isoform X2 [Nematostella vectensis]
MSRFGMQTRRDRVMSLLPPISLVSGSTDIPLEDRIFSDEPPPIVYPGSFPSKILRHLEKNTFYSAPTQGESAITKKIMYADPVKRVQQKDVIPPFKAEAINSNNNNNNTMSQAKVKHKKSSPKKPIQKPQISSKSQVEFGGVTAEDPRTCVSAPTSARGSCRDREFMTRNGEFEPGNLTAPTTPRPVNKTQGTTDSTGSVEAVNAHVNAMPLPPKTVGLKKESIVHPLELRGDAIDIEPHGADYDEFSRAPYTRPNSRAMTPMQWKNSRALVPVASGGLTEMAHTHNEHTNGFYCNYKDSGLTNKPKIRSTIREVPRPLSRTKNPKKEQPKFLIRAVGYNLHNNPRQHSADMLRRNSAERRAKAEKNKKQELEQKEKDLNESSFRETLTLAIMGPKDNWSAVAPEQQALYGEQQDGTVPESHVIEPGNKCENEGHVTEPGNKCENEGHVTEPRNKCENEGHVTEQGNKCEEGAIGHTKENCKQCEINKNDDSNSANANITKLTGNADNLKSNMENSSDPNAKSKSGKGSKGRRNSKVGRKKSRK